MSGSTEDVRQFLKGEPVLCMKPVTDDDGCDGMVWVVWPHASPPPDAPWVGNKELAWKQYGKRR